MVGLMGANKTARENMNQCRCGRLKIRWCHRCDKCREQREQERAREQDQQAAVGDPRYLPTPDEITEAAAVIRNGWSEHEARKRAGAIVQPMEVSEVQALAMLNQSRGRSEPHA